VASGQAAVAAMLLANPPASRLALALSLLPSLKASWPRRLPPHPVVGGGRLVRVGSPPQGKAHQKRTHPAEPRTVRPFRVADMRRRDARSFWPVTRGVRQLP
jgi:hypothetical protein